MVVIGHRSVVYLFEGGVDRVGCREQNRCSFYVFKVGFMFEVVEVTGEQIDRLSMGI